MSKIKKIIIAIIAVALVLVAIVGGIFIYRINNPQLVFDGMFEEEPEKEEVIVNIPEPSLSPIQPIENDQASEIPTPTPTIDPAILLKNQSDVEFMKKRVNVLLLGLDRSTERGNWGSFRTDTMMLVSVNFDDNKVNIISIPRDSYVKIHGSDKRNKVNTAFGTGGGAEKKGYQYAMKTISELFGNVPINYYVGFDMNVVKDVVNAMGGLEYDVDIQVNMNGRKLEKGLQQMDGQAVLDYCRQRKGSSDIARVDRQQRMLLALFDEMKGNKQLTKIPDIYKAVEQNIDTNLSFEQICALALMATKIDDGSILRYTLEGSFLNMNNISYWGVNHAAKQRLVKEIFGKSIPFNKDDDVNVIKKELEAAQKEFASILPKAANLLEKCATLSESLPSNDADRIMGLARELEAAIDDSDIEGIKLTYNNLKELYDSFNFVIPVPEGENVEYEKIPDDSDVPDETDEILPDETEEIVLE